MTHMVY